MVGRHGTDVKTGEFYNDYPFPSYNISTKEKFKEYCKKFKWYLNTIPPDFFINPKNKTILDCGCGTGENSCMFASLGFKVTSFDLSKSSIKKAKLNAKKLKLNIDFKEGNLLTFNTDKKYDMVFCMGVIQHTEQPYDSFHNICRFLKEGGTLVLGTYNNYGSIFPRRLRRKMLDLRFGGNKDKKLKFVLKKNKNLKSCPNYKELILDGTDVPTEWFFSIHEILNWFSLEKIKPLHTHPPISIWDYNLYRREGGKKKFDAKTSLFSSFIVQTLWLLFKKDFFMISGKKGM